MNKVVLIGRLTADPDLKHTQSNTPVCSYRLAVERAYKKEGTPDADFINCTTWGKNAEFVSKYLRKGSRIAIEGRLQSGSYKKEDGTTVYTTDVVAERHEFCDSKKDSSGAKTPVHNSGEYEDMYVEMTTPDDGDLPF